MTEMEYKLMIISLLVGFGLLAYNCENGAFFYLSSILIALAIFVLEYLLMLFLGMSV